MGVLALIEYLMNMMIMMMMMVTKKMMMRIITITLRKCGSFGFPAAPAVALLSLLVPENSFFKCFTAAWLLPQIVC